MAGLGRFVSARLVGVLLMVLALGLFGVLDALGLSGTARAVAFLALTGAATLGALAVLGAWLLHRTGRPLSERPAQDWEFEQELERRAREQDRDEQAVERGRSGWTGQGRPDRVRSDSGGFGDGDDGTR